MPTHAPRTTRILIVPAVIVLLAFASLGAASCGSSNEAAGEKAFSRAIQDKLVQVVDKTMAEYKVPGVIVGVWVPGKGTWIGVRGKANIKTGALPRPADHVRIGSVSKTFTATVVLQLVDEGKLSLDDPVGKFNLGVAVPNGDRITVRNLLNMTSGLFNYTAVTAFWERFLANPTKPWTPKELLDLALPRGVVSEPGQKYDYCNTNYILLGLLIEKLTGNKAGEEITTRIIDKLGLKNTSFPMTARMPSPFMHGYMPETSVQTDTAGPAVKDTSIETATAFWTAGGMISTLADMKTWVQALSQGKLVSPEMHKEQLQFSAPNTESYGLGVMNGQVLIGHSGEVPGYNSAVYTQPKANGATIIVFVNRYPSKIEGVSDQFLVEVITALADIMK